MSSRCPVQVPIPHLDQIEQRIVEKMKLAGGDIVRAQLRQRITGSNTTFAKKIAGLKNKGLVEEYKPSEGRLRTAYRFTGYAARLFNIEHVLKSQQWFSVDQKIQFYPEFDRLAQLTTDRHVSVYDSLGMRPVLLTMETLLATSEAPNLSEEEIRGTLTMCSATLHSIVTKSLQKDLKEKTEGYIIFHYKLEEAAEELHNLVAECLANHIHSQDPLERHKTRSKLIELSIRYPELPPRLAIVAIMAANHLGQTEELQTIRHAYRLYADQGRRKERDLALSEFVLSALDVIRKFYSTIRSGEHEGMEAGTPLTGG